MLWDGAFSHASKIDPTEEDIVMYKRFVLAAVMSHVTEGLSVTPKVHLMWKHVEEQMRFPGGLGWKREDWVEHLHQVTCRIRDQFKYTKNQEARAIAMTRANQRDTDPHVNAQIVLVANNVYRGPRMNYLSKVEERKKTREAARRKVLLQWERENLRAKGCYV